MITYGDLVQYIKDNHINWDTDLFEVLRGFFEQYSQPPISITQSLPYTPSEDSVIFERRIFVEPTDGEYTSEDLLNLFST